MQLKQLERMNSGLYFIHWKSGGGSVAALGRTANGAVWLAPTNWINGVGIHPDEKNYAAHIREIENLELITTQLEACRKRRVETSPAAR